MNEIEYGLACTLAEHKLDMGRLRAENATLRAWIKWALGEGPDPEGKWFGEHPAPPLEARYWWRKHLRLALKE